MDMTTTPPSGEPEAHGSDGSQCGRRGRDGRIRRVWERRASRLAVGVAAAAVALTAAAVAFAQGIGTFRDVPDNHYARDAVQWAVQNGITVGCRDGTYFCPERTVNRAESVTFLHRYQTNVISGLENRVRALEGRPTTPTTPGTTGNSGFGNQPASTTTTAPPRKYTVRGTHQDTSRSFTNLVAGKYDAVFTLEATKAATAHDEPGNVRPAGDCQTLVPPQTVAAAATFEDVTLIRVEYRDRNSSVWKTHAVSKLQLTETNEATNTTRLPAAGYLVSTTPASAGTPIIVEDVPGRLPLSGFLRVSAYMEDNTIDRGGNNAPCDTDRDPDRTTKYAFDWGLVLTENRD